MDVEPCAGCLDAILRQDRDGHPHDLSQAQRILRDESRVGGRIEWPPFGSPDRTT